jgi:hypothetical protein
MDSARCHVSLLAQQSQTPCTAGHTFGCYSSHQMWTYAGCRGKFSCGSSAASARRVACASYGWTDRVNCTCLACDTPSIAPTVDGALRGARCCADNGATIAHGSWDRNQPGNANVSACQDECERTRGCSHYTFTDTADECANELKVRVSGRCTLCAACTLRQHPPTWQLHFNSYSVGSMRTRRHRRETKASTVAETTRQVPALIIS